jgi:two-component system OmpR family sensor kinase
VGQDVTFAAPAAQVTVEGDPVALRRMVGNVIDNALKYGERARLALRSDAGNPRIEIDDDGAGIPETLQLRVFEPFFRAEASRNRNTGDIGLGLAAVRAMVLDHGGEIRLRNRKERGLRVEITLPLPQGA